MQLGTPLHRALPTAAGAEAWKGIRMLTVHQARVQEALVQFGAREAVATHSDLGKLRQGADAKTHTEVLCLAPRGEIQRCPYAQSTACEPQTSTK